ncbi:MAG: AMP-binding protein [Oscillospiraceae bacterium]|jgi:fatty-acyl-CoA synthase|nr:AMP-binding protein [Oscillospiraceae bacterium]
MKLSYKANAWRAGDWSWHCDLAESMELDGIELSWSQDEAAFLMKDEGERQRFLRRLTEKLLEIPSVAVDVSGDGDAENAKHAALACMELAAALRVPYVCLDLAFDRAEDEMRIVSLVGELLPEAERRGVVLLVETRGFYSDTARLCTLLDRFACDNLAALWNLRNTYINAGETADTTIRNLGAYVKLVHVADAAHSGGATTRALVGDGDVPLSEMLLALHSIDYNGHLTLDLTGLDAEAADSDADVILPYYANVMSKLVSDRDRAEKYFDNKRGTGKYIWKKDVLVDLTFSRMLDRVTEEFPDQYAFRYTTLDYTRTYSEFREDVDEFARSLIALGVKPGAKVAIWATNVPQWYITFWASVKIGAVLVTMNTAYKVREAEYLLRQADIHTLVMIDGYKDSDYVSIMRDICPELDYSQPKNPLHCKRLPFLRHVVTISSRQKGCVTWADALKLADNVPIEEVYRREAAVDPDDVCNMQYTSGTTGYPKGVMLTHRNVVNNGKCIGDRMDLSTADRMLIHVQMFHCFGMVLAMTAAVSHSATMSPLPYFSPKPALACIRQERITCFHGVPTMFIALLEHKDFNPADFAYMRTGIMAGSPCPVPVMRDVVEKMNMSEIVIVFGQTESSPGCTMSSTDDSQELRVATVGKALPEIECKIVDPETWADMPDNEAGEFVARGYNIMKGYYKMPEATAAAIDKNGWLHTGDIAVRTPEGYYKITGRLKDMIIRGGENIYPKEIEEFLYTHPKIKDVQVIGVPSEQYGEEICACVVLKAGEELSEKEVKEYVYTNMAKHKTPSYVDFVDDFPMNAAGKILKYQMRTEAIQRHDLQKADAIETA